MIAAPESSEYADFYARYIALVPPGDLSVTLQAQLDRGLPFLRGIGDEKSLIRYEPGKWSVREILGHLTDSERIFACRALRFARADSTPLPGFDQDPYVAAAGFDARPWNDLITEYEYVRRSSIVFFRSLRPEVALRSGIANKASVSVRALGYVIAGHELHHFKVIRERYL